jgi:enoyl-CoA hydratase/carnithine racemase
VNFEEIIYDVEGQIATITLYRPEKLNAQTPLMTVELRNALRLAGEDDDVRAVIMTGAGRAFCAGSDMSAGPRASDGDTTAPAAAGRGVPNSIVLDLFEFPKPVIAAINGAAVGFGVSSTLAMDVRICSTAGRFGFVYSQRGIAPESASSWFLPRVVGVGQALEWMYSGRVFGAEEALAGGLVSEVVEPEELLDRAREIAEQIVTQTSAVSIAIIRRLVWQGLGVSHPSEVAELESELTRATRGSADAREGILSFLEQRAPAFTGSISDALKALEDASR